MNLKALIFDLDGTIADTIPLTVHSLRQAILKYTGKNLSDIDILKEFGPIDTEIARKLAGEENGEDAIEEYINHFSENFDSYVAPIEGMEDLLQYIKSRDIKVGLFTGRSQRATEVVLDKLKLRNYFDEIVAGDFTVNPKPSPEGIYIALGKLGVEACEAAYIGDYDVDVMASKSAGTVSVLAAWSSTGSKELESILPDKIFTNTKDFKNWLESL